MYWWQCLFSCGLARRTRTLSRWFYSSCQRVITPEGYFYHKYNPDGSPASSWHPWIIKGHKSLPIQEDETALVVWATMLLFSNHAT